MAVLAFPSADTLTLRRLALNDGPHTLRIFRDAVRHGAQGCYNEAERNAWAPLVIDAGSWMRERLAQPTWVAEIRGAVVGFSDLTDDGEVGMLYVDSNFTRRGVGSALLAELERQAREEGRITLHARVSLIAEPLFTRAGFLVVRRQWAERGGERLAQAIMEKVLEPF